LCNIQYPITVFEPPPEPPPEPELFPPPGVPAPKRPSDSRLRGHVPFGYRLADDCVTLVESPSEQAIIREMGAWRAAGWSWRQIADELTRRAVRTKQGRVRWNRSSAEAIVQRSAARAALGRGVEMAEESAHAARSQRLFGRGLALEAVGPERLFVPEAQLRAELLELPELKQLAFGAVIGVVELVDVVPLEQVAGEAFAEGPWCWLLERPSAIDPPVPCRGMPGVFEVRGVREEEEGPVKARGDGDETALRAVLVDRRVCNGIAVGAIPNLRPGCHRRDREPDGALSILGFSRAQECPYFWPRIGPTRFAEWSRCAGYGRHRSYRILPDGHEPTTDCDKMRVEHLQEEREDIWTMTSLVFSSW